MFHRVHQSRLPTSLASHDCPKFNHIQAHMIHTIHLNTEVRIYATLTANSKTTAITFLPAFVAPLPSSFTAGYSNPNPYIQIININLFFEQSNCHVLNKRRGNAIWFPIGNLI